ASLRQNSDNFRAIVEAYKVLGKADSRASYDAGINLYNRPYGVYDFTEQSRSVPPSNYYGVFGKERISNKRIVLYCMLFMLAGIIVQTLAIRYSLTFRREKLDKMSAKAAKMHSLARANAVEFGNDYQLEKFAQKCAENARS
ncbi:DnaJ-like protein 60, partial [Pseudolycoriella hygida]